MAEVWRDRIIRALDTCGSDGVPPIGVPPVSHHSSTFSESWGKILGLIAAALVGNAATVPALQERAVQGNAVGKSGSQSDTTCNTTLRVTDSLSRLRGSNGKSRDDGLSSGHTQSPTHTALSATDGLWEPQALDDKKVQVQKRPVLWLRSCTCVTQPTT